jgi:hypothetical protein
MTFFTEIEKNNTKIHMETQRPRLAIEILNKKRNAGSIIISDFKLYDTAILTKPSLALAHRPM